MIDGLIPLYLDPEKPCVALLQGDRGSGKTHIVTHSLVNLKDMLEEYEFKVFLFVPTAEFQEMYQWLMEEIEIEEIVKDIPTENDIQAIKSRVVGSKGKERLLLIIDDVDEFLKHSHCLNFLIIASRHMNVYMILMAQRYTQTPTIIRGNCNQVMIWRYPENSPEWKQIREQYLCEFTLDLQRHVRHEIYGRPFQKEKKHAFLNLVRDPTCPLFVPYNENELMVLPGYNDHPDAPDPLGELYGQSAFRMVEQMPESEKSDSEEEDEERGEGGTALPPARMTKREQAGSSYRRRDDTPIRSWDQ